MSVASTFLPVLLYIDSIVSDHDDDDDDDDGCNRPGWIRVDHLSRCESMWIDVICVRPASHGQSPWIS